MAQVTINPLESLLREAFQEADARAKVELGFGMPRLIEMTDHHGAIETAHRILPTLTKMFTTLWERSRLDLSVEAIILQPRFAPLFTEDELQVARQRLQDSNYHSVAETHPADLEGWDRTARRSRRGWAEENPY